MPTGVSSSVHVLFRVGVVATALWVVGSGAEEAVATHARAPGVSVRQPDRGGNRFEFEHRPGRVGELRPATYAPHFLEGAYSEIWHYVFRFPTGHTIISRLVVTNRGPGEGRGGGVAIIIGPDGKVVQQVNSRPRDRWAHALLADGVSLSVAGHTWDIRPPVHELQLRSRRGHFRISATTTTDIYRPGRLWYSAERFYDLTVLAPRLEAQGVLELPGETPIELGVGHGVAFHSQANLDDDDLALSWLQVHTFDDDIQLSLWELTAPGDRRFQRVSLSLVFEHGQLVTSGQSYGRAFGELRRDPESPHYPVPGQVIVSGREETHAFQGAITLRPRHRLELVDLINSGVVRFLVRRLMQPVAYEFAADYDLTIALRDRPRRMQGTGLASLQIIGKPPEDASW